MKSIDLTELGITFLESFKRISGFSESQFVQYMNNNNMWDILNDTHLIRGLMGADIEDIVEIIGRYLSLDERHNIISRYNSRF